MRVLWKGLLAFVFGEVRHHWGANIPMSAHGYTIPCTGTLVPDARA